MASVLLTAETALHPVNGGLVEIAVVSASFGLNLGLLIVPAFISWPIETDRIATRTMSFDWLWLTFGLAAAIAFLSGLGRTIRF